jgi:P27 family predicted phage terminase small subunit
MATPGEAGPPATSTHRVLVGAREPREGESKSQRPLEHTTRAWSLACGRDFLQEPGQPRESPMKPGRKSKPAHLKLLEGNPSKRPIRRAVEPPPARPNCPRWLPVEGRREWARIVPVLDNLGLLSVVDRATLAAYCDAWARLREASEDVTRRGLTIETERQRFSRNGTLLATDIVELTNPSVKIAADAAERIRRFATEFGLTPASRLKEKTAESDPAAEAVLD